MKPIIRIVLHVPVEEKEWIHNLAQKEHIAVVNLIRTALDEYKDRHHPDIPDRPGRNNGKD